MSRRIPARLGAALLALQIATPDVATAGWNDRSDELETDNTSPIVTYMLVGGLALSAVALIFVIASKSGGTADKSDTNAEGASSDEAPTPGEGRPRPKKQPRTTAEGTSRTAMQTAGAAQAGVMQRRDRARIDDMNVHLVFSIGDLPIPPMDVPGGAMPASAPLYVVGLAGTF